MAKEQPPPGIDYSGLAAALDECREVLRILVAGLVADGFNDREAHAIVTHFVTLSSQGNPPGQGLAS